MLVNYVFVLVDDIVSLQNEERTLFILLIAACPSMIAHTRHRFLLIAQIPQRFAERCVLKCLIDPELELGSLHKLELQWDVAQFVFGLALSDCFFGRGD